MCDKVFRIEGPHSQLCWPKCEFKDNEKSDETAFTQLQELKNAVKELLDDKVIHEKKIASLEKSIKQNYSENVKFVTKYLLTGTTEMSIQKSSAKKSKEHFIKSNKSTW